MKVPIIESSPPPEFGELTSSPDFMDANAMNGDLTYVPGFSELRFARDQAINEARLGKRRASEVPSLPVNFRWARCEDKKGEPDNRKVVRASNRGYRPITKDDVGEGKLLPSLPAGARFSADGMLRQGDTQLMVAAAKDVARNEFQKRARTLAATKSAEEGFASALREVGGAPVKGASPFIQKEVGHTVRAELNPKTKAKEV